MQLSPTSEGLALQFHEMGAPARRQEMAPQRGCLPVLVGAVALEHHLRQKIAFVLDNSARKELEQRKDDFISMASHELKKTSRR